MIAIFNHHGFLTKYFKVRSILLRGDRRWLRMHACMQLYALGVGGYRSLNEFRNGNALSVS